MLKVKFSFLSYLIKTISPFISLVAIRYGQYESSYNRIEATNSIPLISGLGITG